MMEEQSNALKEPALRGCENQRLATAERKKESETVELTPKLGHSAKAETETPRLSSIVRSQSVLVTPLDGTSLRAARFEKRLQDNEGKLHSFTKYGEHVKGKIDELEVSRMRAVNDINHLREAKQLVNSYINKCDEVEELIKRYDKMKKLRKELAEIEMYVMNRKLSVATSEQSKLKSDLSRLESQNRCLLVVSIVLCLLLAVATIERFTHLLICLL
jgi:DNA repair exonuclease SbcCD ATPase subunit